MPRKYWKISLIGFSLCVHMCLCMGVRVSVDVHGGQKRALCLLELELKVAVSCLTGGLGTTLRSSVRTAAIVK